MKVILRVHDEGYSKSTWWRLFQKRVVRTKFDIYVFLFFFHTAFAKIFCKLNIIVAGSFFSRSQLLFLDIL
jgi:hypothetical protein